MKVIFKVEGEEQSEFFRDIVDAFVDAKCKDIDSLNLATLEVDNDKAVYTTCCGNKWFIERRSDDVIFGYQGTRNGAALLMPFQDNLKWQWLDEKEPRLKVVREWAEIIEKYESKEIIREIHRIPVKSKVYKLQIMEYKTSTPPEWGLWWCDDVIHINGTDSAVILRGRAPIKVVPYKNVYEER